MKKYKEKFRYLDARLKISFVAFCILAFLLVLCLDREWIFSEGFWKIAMIFLLVLLVGFTYLWIWKPYRRLINQVQRFSDGYISLADLTDVEVAISPEFERMARHMNKIVTATRTHFLYNTLEGIRSEAIMAGLDNLADMTEALAIFFRYTISKVENLVTVEEELENCATYFKIQQYRFGSRIHLEIEQDEEDWDDILHCMIPKLTLQPILENSIIHGIELKLDEGKVTISISRTKSRLLIKVSDDGVGMNRETLDKLNAKLGSKEEEVKNYTQPEKGGVALVNVNNRIHLIFGEEYGMHVYSLENMGTSVELSIPVIYNENELKKKDK